MNEIPDQSGVALPSINHGYNKDVFIPDDVKQSVPKIRSLLEFEPLLQEFNRSDIASTKNKLSFHRFGRISLILSFVALTGISIEILLLGMGIATDSPLPPLLIEGSALLAIGALIYMRKCRFRSAWQQAMFARERIRHWRWQVLLDGRLVEAYVAGSIAGQPIDSTELFRAWTDFRKDLFEESSGLDPVPEFQRTNPSEATLIFRRTPYDDKDIEEEVLRLLGSHRFRYQIQYPTHRTKGNASTEAVPLSQHASLAENVAQIMLLVAILVPALHLGFVVANEFGVSNVTQTMHLSFSVVALWAATVSGLCRAYRAGMTLPEELESYEEYAARIQMFTDLYGREDTEEGKHALHLELEIEAQRELRRFLVMKSKATFLL